MKCISPIRIKQNDQFHTVPCGKCVFCRNRKRQEWTFRIEQELKVSTTAFFITLTYDEDHIPITENGETTLIKSDLQKYHKRLRKALCKYESRPKMRYYAVGEYGSKSHRAHYHTITFNVPVEIIRNLDKYWTYGNIHVGTVNSDSIGYVTKYLITEQELDYTDRQRPFAMMSTKPPLGVSYLEKTHKFHKNHKAKYVIRKGKKTRMPRFYSDRIFNKVEKEIIALKEVEQHDKKQKEEIQKLEKYGYENPEYELELRKEAFKERMSKYLIKNRTL